MDLAGKKIFITGASSGIGRATALLCARHGALVFAGARSSDKLAALAAEAREAGQTIVPVTIDVTDAHSIQAATQLIFNTTDGYGIDVLVNNAGYGQMGPIEELDLDNVRQQFETNVVGLIAVTQQFLPAMRSRHAGHIFNVSSIGGRFAMAFGGAYTATKFSVEAISDALRWEVAHWNIRVTVIEPGIVATGFGPTAVERLDVAADTAYPEVYQFIKIFEQKDVGTDPMVVAEDIVEEIGRKRPAIRKASPWFWGLILALLSMVPVRVLDWLYGKMLQGRREKNDSAVLQRKHP